MMTMMMDCGYDYDYRSDHGWFWWETRWWMLGLRSGPSLWALSHRVANGRENLRVPFASCPPSQPPRRQRGAPADPLYPTWWLLSRRSLTPKMFVARRDLAIYTVTSVDRNKPFWRRPGWQSRMMYRRKIELIIARELPTRNSHKWGPPPDCCTESCEMYSHRWRRRQSW